MRWLFSVLFVVLGVAACTPWANVNLVTQAPGVGTELPVLFGTTRAELGPAQSSRELRVPRGFVRHVISVPPDHEAGIVELGGRSPEPRSHFVTREVRPLYSRGFRQPLAANMRSAGTNEVVLFVHGFKNSLAGGAFRLAQMEHDLVLPGVALHYSWPFAANPLGYMRDHDSASLDRAGISGLPDETARSGAKDIVLVAHSMDAIMPMETRIWMGPQGGRLGLSALEGVGTLSPDFDAELSRVQADAIQGLPQPFIIFGSSQDRSFVHSERLTGERDRLGSLTDVSRVADLEVALIDGTSVEDSASRRLAGITSPTMLGPLGQAARVDASIGHDPSARAGPLPGTVLSVQNATAVIVAPPG